jgi:hypothetical protein
MEFKPHPIPIQANEGGVVIVQKKGVEVCYDNDRPSFFTEEDMIADEIMPDLEGVVDRDDPVKTTRNAWLREMAENPPDSKSSANPMESDQDASQASIPNEKIEDIFYSVDTENVVEDEKLDDEIQVNQVMVMPEVAHKIKNNAFQVNDTKPPKAFKPTLSMVVRQKVTLPSCAGYLKKKSPYAIQGWQNRYCILENKRFLYYEENNLDKVVGCLDFDQISIKLEEFADQQFIMSPYGSKKTFLFKARDKTTLKRWLDALKANLQASEGAERILTLTAEKTKFWKNQRVSEDYFLKNGDTMDLLLFRAKNVGAKIQRGITGSEYGNVQMSFQCQSLC